MVRAGPALSLGLVHPAAREQHTWVARPRLHAALDAGAGGTEVPVALITAPAGAGKSVLARQWLKTDDRPHLEVPVGPAVDDPSALISALVQALEQVGRPARNLGASITSTEPRFSTIVLPAVARLAATRDTAYVLVVDDVHLLRNPACHDVLLAVCDATPSGSRVLLLTRDESPPWLARTRVEGRLLEVTAQDLRFDVAEAADLYRRMGVDGRGVDVSDLVAQTEGWAVGLYLAGLALARSRAEATRPPDSATVDGPRLAPSVVAPNRSIDAYIATQVLPPLDEDLQAFVLRTSVLGELGAGLCDAVLERDDSVALLARLREQLQLVIPVDADGTRLRYHHLLADALVHELVRREPAEVPVLHVRAARWYADNGLLDEAIRHAKAAQDLAEVGRLVWSGTARCIAAGDLDQLAFWLADLSEEEVSRDGWLVLAAAWLALQSGEPERMDRWILRAESHAGDGWRSRAESDTFTSHLAVLVALVSREGLAESEALSDAALRGLPVDSPYRTAALFVHGVALTLTRRYDPGRRALVAAERLARVLDVPIIQADALAWQGVLALAAGDLSCARRLIEAAQGVIRDHHLERLATAAHSITATSLLEALRHEPSTTTTLATARRLTTQIDDVVPWFSVCGRLVQARAAVAIGDGAMARQLIAEAKVRMTHDLLDSLASDLLEDAERSLAALTVDGAVAPALTAAEMRVLQFLPSHLQLPQIGEHLFVSPNTVKTHVMAIHRKLGVTSRDQAVARARELGLLEAPAID